MTEQKELSPGAPGDDRTPDKTIGEVKYAERKTSERKTSERKGSERKGSDAGKSGGAGQPETPEKQGGIGGP